MDSKLVELTDENFEEEVVNSPIPVMVDFYANWCGPCRSMTPALESLCSEMEGNLKIGKVNIEKTSISSKYSISSIPAILMFKDGKVVDRKIGLQDKKSLIALAIGGSGDDE